MILEISKASIKLHDAEYVLSEWDIKNGKAINYISQVAADIMSVNPRNILIVGLGGGSVLGELARLGLGTIVLSLVTCVEIDDRMIQHYHTFKQYYKKDCNPSIMHCDFMHLNCKNSFDVIFGDIPCFYEETSVEQKQDIVSIMMRHSRVGTVWILNVLFVENMREWIHFFRDANLPTSRVRPCYWGGNCLLKLKIIS